uniref:Dystroglycan-type cadherin-like domain-containing protein n=1 Tax=Candidatus Kentrum sp. LFY TaxID=2126342 RepID=A0A450U9K1_9GAMM|nr:MAG: hypothetical protein BECKLFY1418A_GA0070994_100537 [Candidatus Kentron sp. LFY]
MHEETNTVLGGIPSGHLGLLALEPRIMFDGSGIDLGDISYDPNDPDQGKRVPIVVDKDKDIFSKNWSYSSDNHVHFDLASKGDSDKFHLKNSSDDINEKDAISVGEGKNAAGNHDLYLGTGTKRIKIGEVIGQDTKDLRIRFSDRILNHNFEKDLDMKKIKEGEANPKDAWSAEGRIISPGMSKIAGWTVPSRSNSPPDPPVLPREQESTLVDEDWFPTLLPRLDSPSEGKYLNIPRGDLPVPSGGYRYGPYVCSNEFDLIEGELFGFDWHDEGKGGNDKGDPFFYLLNTDNGKTFVLNENSSGNWDTWTKRIKETGSYRSIAVVGAIDESNAGSTGHSLGLDNLKVELSATILNTIAEQVTYEYSSKSEPADDPREVTIRANLDDGEWNDIARVKLDIQPSPQPPPTPSPPSPPPLPLPSRPQSGDPRLDRPVIPSPLPDILPGDLAPITSIDRDPLGLSSGFTQGDRGFSQFTVGSLDPVESNLSEAAWSLSPAEEFDATASRCYGIDGHCLSAGREIEAIFVEDGRLDFQIPLDTFIHTNPEAKIELLQPTLADGSPLPDWIRFNPLTGVFAIEPPVRPEQKVITVEVIASDRVSGCQARTTFDLRVGGNEEKGVEPEDNRGIGEYHGAPAPGSDTERPVGRPGFSAQLASAGLVGFEMRQAAFIATIGGTG